MTADQRFQRLREGEAFSIESTGMTLRDYFAAKALAGWMASYTDTDSYHPGSKPEYSESVAKHSYAVADAMLAERAKPQP